jgi:hypothetical protein
VSEKKVIDPARSQYFATLGRIGARVTHSRWDARDLTAAATEAQLARFDRLVDPEGKLPEQERKRRAKAALSAHMTRLALRSVEARRRSGRLAIVRGRRS